MTRLKSRRAHRTAHNPQQFSVLDLGGSAVKALVVEVQDGRATVLGRGQARHTQALDDRGLIANLDALIGACEEALRDAEDATERVREAKLVPDIALFAVPTAWTRGAMGVGGVERTALELPITREECVEPLVRAGRRAMRNLGRLTDDGEWQLLDATLIAFSINGNPVTEPVGFRGHELQAAVFVVAARRDQLAALPKIAEALQLEPPQMVAEPLALAATLAESGLLIQVGQVTTQAVLVRKGAPLAVGHIPCGGRQWIRALTDTFHLSPERADALLRAWSSGRLTPQARQTVEQVCRPLWDEWLRALIAEIRRWEIERLEWPPTIYLCGGAMSLSPLREQIGKAPWHELLPFQRTPDVRIWDGANLNLLNDLAEPRWPIDGVTALSVAAWGIRNRSSETTDGILRQALEIY